ncbi:unnamed protein product [Ilex paraguariensis]|uniref:Uncharacterized protein n=1 Tax=Ilex paraguariensis TaxID=185542 RepID=A0ABC8TCU2_9AQUA
MDTEANGVADCLSKGVVSRKISVNFSFLDALPSPNTVLMAQDLSGLSTVRKKLRLVRCDFFPHDAAEWCLVEELGIYKNDFCHIILR